MSVVDYAGSKRPRPGFSRGPRLPRGGAPPRIRAQVNGARRWFRAGDLSFQPSGHEDRPAAVHRLVRLEISGPAADFRHGFLPIAGAIALAAGLTASSPTSEPPPLLEWPRPHRPPRRRPPRAHALPGVLVVIPLAASRPSSKFGQRQKRILVFMNPTRPARRRLPDQAGLLPSARRQDASASASPNRNSLPPRKNTDFIFSSSAKSSDSSAPQASSSSSCSSSGTSRLHLPPAPVRWRARRAGLLPSSTSASRPP